MRARMTFHPRKNTCQKSVNPSPVTICKQLEVPQHLSSVGFNYFRSPATRERRYHLLGAAPNARRGFLNSCTKRTSVGDTQAISDRKSGSGRLGRHQQELAMQ